METKDFGVPTMPLLETGGAEAAEARARTSKIDQLRN